MKKHTKKQRETKQQPSITITYCCKFIENYQNETSKLLEYNYDKLYEKFKKLYNDALESLNDGNTRTDTLAKKLCKPTEQKLSTAKVEQEEQQQQQQKQTRKRRLSEESIIECDENEKPKRQAKNKANAKIAKTKIKKQEHNETSDNKQQQHNKPEQIEPKTPHQSKITNTNQIESTIKRTKVQEIADKFEEQIRLNSCQRPQPPSTIKKIENPTIKRALRFNNPQQQQQQQSTSSSSSIANAGIRTSIDNRKIRTSLAKCETKQKSIKKLNAFVKTIQINEQQTPSVSNNNNNQQISNDVTLNSDSKRITANQLLSNTFVQQQFKVSSKTNNSKYPDRKASFAKFLERNTPVKCTKTELEEKRKAELLTKEKREQDRLHEIEKEKQEKIEIAKKKREERMRKIVESKAKRQEDDQKRKEEYEQKCKEIEENRKKIAEEKKRELQDKLKQAEDKRIMSATTSSASTTAPSSSTTATNSINTSSISNSNPVVVLTALKLNNYQKSQLLPPPAPPSSSTSSSTSNSKPLAAKQAQQTTANKPPLKPLEITYVLNTPAVEIVQNKIAQNAAKENLAGKVLNNSAYNQYLSPSKGQSYPVTPLTEQVYKLKDENNYDVSQLCSEDETDDEEEPRKPIPQWAKEPYITRKAKGQTMAFLNYTKLFKSSSNCEIKLEQIFRTKRKKFTERSSSAFWNTPPVWNSDGISGNESFRALK